MQDTELHVCPHCGKLLKTAEQVTFGFCKPKCRDKHEQEVRDYSKIAREVRTLMRQYEEQTGRRNEDA